MNNYEDWAQLVAKNLEHESNFLAAIDKDELDDKAATEAFVRAVLEPFLPENYGIGAGRIIDAFGKTSEFLDIIVYNRDFPRIGMRGTHNTYLYESVLAAFAIRAKFIRKTFFDSLNACASMSHLETRADQAVLVKLAKKNGLKPGPNKTFVHDDPLRTARFELIGRPPAFVFGFSGFKFSYRQLQENIELWISNRQNVGIATPMKALPAVIATQGCFAWRNAAPLALSNREMLGIGNDDAPVRLIALQLLYLLNRRLGNTSDGYGLKPNLNAYLSQFSAPKFELGVGDVAEVLPLKKEEAGSDEPASRAARDTQRFESARDHAAVAEAAARAATASKTAERPATDAVSPMPAAKAAEPVVPQAKAVEAAAAPQAASPEPAAKAPEPAAKAVESQPAPAAKPAESQPAPAAAKPAELAADAVVFDKPSPFASAPAIADEQPAAASASTGAAVFDKPSPFASAPAPVAEAPAAQNNSADAAVFDKPSPFASAPSTPADEPPGAADTLRSPAPIAPLGSAPIPTMQGADDSMPVPEAELVKTAAEEPPAPPSAPLGSAPIPPSDTPSPAEHKPAAAAKIIPPKPPVDIDLGIGGKDTPAEQVEASSEDDDFIETVVIPPNAGLSSQEKSRNSTDAFIARVKEQLSSNEPMKAENGKDFTSTIPQ